MNSGKMANQELAASITDHDYIKAGLREACFDDSVELEQMELQMEKTHNDHTPLPSPNPKKLKKRDTTKEVSMENIYDAIQALSQRFEERLDELDKKFENIELRIQANEKELKENRDELNSKRKLNC